ncbi:lipopolysaccharide biosynthesis protein [Mycolicibacterium stellerae]|uniref:lipopolysaccharide biosynthesis protein n=1 Tax=Mycolicibacterium stellerae TaxID=2358193 RepID=UPI000F0B930E|nr:teichoic acid transporter [Mycolicibacterium stellerae]
MSTKLSAGGELRRGFVLRVAAAAAGMASMLLMTVVVVRSLEAHEAATFFAILASLSFGAKIGCLGMGPNVIRLVAMEPDPQVRRKITGTHLQATFLLSCVTAPIIAVIGLNGLFGHASFFPAFVMTTLLIIVETTRLMISDIFTATGRVHASVATMHYIRSVIALPFVVALVFGLHHKSLFAVLGTYLAVATVQLAIAVVHARKDISYFDISGGFATLRTATKEGTQLFSLDLAEFLMLQGTIWLATALFSPTVATQYAAAVTLAMQVTILEALTGLAVAAPASRLWAAGKKDEVVRMLSNSATLNAFIVLVFVALLTVFGRFVVETAYDSSMAPAATFLLILAVGGIVDASFKRSITLLIVSGSITAAARTAIVVLGFAFPTAIVAALLAGPTALAMVTSVSIAVMAVAQWNTARRALGRAPRAHRHIILAARDLFHDSGAGTDSAPDIDVTDAGTPTSSVTS